MGGEMRTVKEIRKDLIEANETYELVSDTLFSLTPVLEDYTLGQAKMLEKMKEDIYALLNEMEAAYSAEKET